MTHFAFIAPPFTSHVRALEALAVALLGRGHRVSWLAQADVRRELRDPRIGFEALGADTHPAGSLDAVVTRTASPGGPLGLRRVILDVAAATRMICREAPAAARRLGVQAVVADQMEAGGGMVAEALGLPFVSVACALPVNREPALPLPVMPWGYAADEAGLHRNDVSARIYDWLMSPHAEVIRTESAALGIARKQTLADCVSPLLQLSQTTPGFDFPRAAQPAGFRHVGPLRPPAAQEAPFEAPPSGRPFVFASLGTLQGGRLSLFKRIARACAAIDAQLLVAHCDRLSEAQADTLRRIGRTTVCGFAPQRAVLARADAVVTHAGINTVMDALVAGTPMLCLPIAFDQPGAAARVVHSGSGLRQLPMLASARSIARDLRRLLDEPAFAQRAATLGLEIEPAGGTARAADLIEVALGIAGTAGGRRADGVADPASGGKADAVADTVTGVRDVAAIGTPITTNLTSLVTTADTTAPAPTLAPSPRPTHADA